MHWWTHDHGDDDDENIYDGTDEYLILLLITSLTGDDGDDGDDDNDDDWDDNLKDDDDDYLLCSICSWTWGQFAILQLGRQSLVIHL